ncbi:hypothetical protein M407DRAFT_32872 [Tulasnella calospora MUT 4182]|uniref:Uncharacterized protein n=1 Tax=Tulasnella calospora MUT 4182 TaxID=1051891 RepID=A0A0C3Q399_9AGAM|nr:hypothetical protein M407DRAFT_32872 [Tulasnella calospora MUT 4182]
MVTQHVVEALEVEYESIPPFDDPRTLFIPDNQIPGCDALGMKWKMTDTTAAAEAKFCSSLMRHRLKLRSRISGPAVCWSYLNETLEDISVGASYRDYVSLGVQ